MVVSVGRAPRRNVSQRVRHLLGKVAEQMIAAAGSARCSQREPDILFSLRTEKRAFPVSHGQLIGNNGRILILAPCSPRKLEPTRTEKPLRAESHRGLCIHPPKRARLSASMTFQTPAVGASSKFFWRRRSMVRETASLRVHYAMTKPTGCGWWLLAGWLASSYASAQTLTNQSLNGKFFFHQMSLGTDGSGSITGPAQHHSAR